MRGTVGASRVAWALLLAMLVIGRLVVADEVPTLTTRLAEADRLLATGELRQAQSMLEVLQAQLPPDVPPEQRAAVSARLGAVLGETGEDEQALSSWRRARGSRGCRPKRSTTWAMCSCAPMRSRRCLPIRRARRWPSRPGYQGCACVRWSTRRDAETLGGVMLAREAPQRAQQRRPSHSFLPLVCRSAAWHGSGRGAQGER